MSTTEAATLPEPDDAGFDWVSATAAGAAEQVRTMPPGVQLAELLSVVDPARLPMDERVDTIVAWERLAAWVSAGQAAALAALDAPADASDPGARARVICGDDWAREEVACALRVSAITAGNRLHVARELATRFPRTRAALADGALTYRKATDIVMETGALSDDAAAAVEAQVLPAAPTLTPAALCRALRRAVLAADPADAHERHQRARAEREVRMRGLPDGMAELWALLPAEGAATVMNALTARAIAYRSAPSTEHSRQPAEPLDARRADALVDICAAELADGASGVGGAHGAGGRVRPGAAVGVTVPMLTLLGLSDEPGELAGYGPITAQVARLLAADGGWRRLLTEDGTGRLLDYGRTTYRPPAPLADYLRARDQTCTFPCCAMPADRCDLDHAIPYDDGGETNPANMGALCRRHHRAKHEGGWRLVRDEHGCTWTSPAGETYRTHPPGYA